MNQFPRIFLLFFLLLALCVPQASARLLGEVEWGYAHFEQSGGGDDYSASHFTQRYSMLYDMQGLLGGGRLGAYDLGLGAEWATFDSDFDGEELSRDAFKLLYEGHVQIAPGALPFRLNAYSYDLRKMSFGTSSMSGLINPDIVSDLYNGQTIISGVQFMAGIRNGSYLGQYRDILSQWPRLLVDYRDVYHRDLKARNPQEYRDSNLAFVSLNKKDNWFHYRLHTHTDYQRPEENSSESVIMLGTIDHTLKRQWINLTNWIRISVDGSYTVTEETWDDRETNRFDVNFFTTMQRNGFSGGSYANLQRVQRGDFLEHTFDLPIYLSNRINPDTNLRSTFELWRNKETRSIWSEELSEDAYYARALLEGNQRGRVLVTPSMEMELHTGDVGEGEAVRGRVEVSSNPKRRQNPAWHGMGSLARFGGVGEDNEDTSLWEGELSGSTDFRLGNTMRIGGQQYLLYGSGSYESRVTHFMSSASAGGFGRYSSRDSQTVDGSLLRSETNLYFEHTSPARVQNRFQLNYKFEDGDAHRLYNLELTHQLSYQSRWWRVRFENLYATGDDVNSNTSPVSDLGQSFIQSSRAGRFEHRGLVEFLPNNYWRARLEESYYWGEDSAGQKSQFITVRQSVQRTFYTFGGLRRKRGEVSQSVLYEHYLNDNDRQAVTFTLTGDYYPNTWWRLGASLDYYYRDFATDTLFYTLTTGIDFPMFMVDFRYRYGAEQDTDVVAHRYEVNVRKTF